MTHDPASPEFEALPKEQQAFILRHRFAWTLAALAEEFGVMKSTIRRWTDPDFRDREIARKKTYRQTEAGKLAAQEQDRRYRASGRRSFVRKRMDAIA